MGNNIALLNAYGNDALAAVWQDHEDEEKKDGGLFACTSLQVERSRACDSLLLFT
jgi:hypothetical protein